MGDRTNVTITIRAADYESILKTHFGGDEAALENKFGTNQVEENDNLVQLDADERNYGNWDELENFLSENKVEYDKFWGAGSEYSEGNKYCRIVNGKYREIEVYGAEESLKNFIEKVLKEKDPLKIVKALKAELKRITPFEVFDLKRNTSVDLILDLEKETKKAKKKKG